MRIARMGFNRNHMLQFGGITLDLMKDIFNYLPSDAKFVGCGADNLSFIDYLLFYSDFFEDVPSGSSIPELTVMFKREWVNGKSVDSVTGIDFGKSKASNQGINSTSCPHFWEIYTGLLGVEESCKYCKIKKT